jgi:hypothetical protein
MTYAGDEKARLELRQAKIDEAAVELWELTAEELAKIRRSLKEPAEQQAGLSN